jgi:hypothetical protein
MEERDCAGGAAEDDAREPRMKLDQERSSAREEVRRGVEAVDMEGRDARHTPGDPLILVC